MHERLATPLRLTGLYAPGTPGELRATALPGRSRRGRLRAPWTGEAVAPAGGLRAPVTTLAGLTAALLDGSAPGTPALDPVARFSGRATRIGAGWITLRVRERDVT